MAQAVALLLNSVTGAYNIAVTDRAKQDVAATGTTGTVCEHLFVSLLVSADTPCIDDVDQGWKQCIVLTWALKQHAQHTPRTKVQLHLQSEEISTTNASQYTASLGPGAVWSNSGPVPQKVSGRAECTVHN